MEVCIAFEGQALALKQFSAMLLVPQRQQPRSQSAPVPLRTPSEHGDQGPRGRLSLQPGVSQEEGGGVGDSDSDGDGPIAHPVRKKCLFMCGWLGGETASTWQLIPCFKRERTWRNK